MAKSIPSYLALAMLVGLVGACGGRSSAYEAGKKECADPTSVAVVKPFLFEGRRAAATRLLQMKNDLARTLHKPVRYRRGTAQGKDWVDGCAAALSK